MEIKMFVYVVGREVYKDLSFRDENRLDRFITHVRPDESFPVLANVCVLCGLVPETTPRTIQLDEIDFPFNIFVQVGLAKNLLRRSIFEKVTSPDFYGRPIFFRQQLLFLMKKVIMLGDPEGNIRPTQIPDDWYVLGRLCLEVTNFMDPDRPKLDGYAQNSGEQLRNDLIARLSPGYELLHPPSFQRGVARSLAILSLLEARDPDFCDGKSLSSYFAERMGLRLTTFFEITMAIYAHFLTVTESDDVLSNLPTKFHLDRKDYFRLLAIESDELDAYFELLSRRFADLKDELKDEMEARYAHCDFTTFRRFPIVFLDETRFTCIDIGFLLEKVGFGFFRTIHNTLPMDRENPNRKDKVLANRLSSWWGDAVEIYVNEIFSAVRGFVPNVRFKSAKNANQQIDGLVSEGSSVALIEVKAQYLTAAAKYGETSKLLDELNDKFGLKRRVQGKGSRGAVEQLLCDIEVLFPETSSSTFEFSCPTDFLESSNVYPVLVIDDNYVTCPFIQWRLIKWFSEGLATKQISSRVTVEPLLVISLDFLEEIEPYLKDSSVSFLEFCRFWASRIHSNPQFWEYDSWTSLMLFLKSKGLMRARNGRVQDAFDAFMTNLKGRVAPD